MDPSHGRPGDKEGGSGAGPPGGLPQEQVRGTTGLDARCWGPRALGLGLPWGESYGHPNPGPGLWDTLSFCLAPQIEPSSHHLSPEEVRIRVFWGYRGALGSRPASSQTAPCQGWVSTLCLPCAFRHLVPASGMCPGCQGGWWRSDLVVVGGRGIPR